MCVAAMGKVLSIENEIAIVDFNGNHIQALAGLVNVKVDDYVMVHAGCIIQTVTLKDMEEWQEISALMAEVDGSNETNS